MKDPKKYTVHLDEAKLLFANGHDNKYIELQLAEQGVDDNTIDKILVEIKRIRKGSNRKSGLKLVLYGASFLVAATVFMLISFSSESPVRYVLWGLIVVGVVTLAKGLTKIIGG